MLELTKRAPFTFSAASFAASSSADLVLDRHVERIDLDGLAPRARRAPARRARARRGARARRRFARACATACRATRATSSRVRSRLAANPHAPPTSVRTPKPKVSLSEKPGDAPLARADDLRCDCGRCARRRSWAPALRSPRRARASPARGTRGRPAAAARRGPRRGGREPRGGRGGARKELSAVHLLRVLGIGEGTPGRYAPPAPPVNAPRRSRQRRPGPGRRRRW